MSSYFKECRDCGRRIQLRRMPGGQWVAFEGYDTVHDCAQPPTKRTNGGSPSADASTSQDVRPNKARPYEQLTFAEGFILRKLPGGRWGATGGSGALAKGKSAPEGVPHLPPVPPTAPAGGPGSDGRVDWDKLREVLAGQAPPGSSPWVAGGSRKPKEFVESGSMVYPAACLNWSLLWRRPDTRLKRREGVPQPRRTKTPANLQASEQKNDAAGWLGALIGFFTGRRDDSSRPTQNACAGQTPPAAGTSNRASVQWSSIRLEGHRSPVTCAYLQESDGILWTGGEDGAICGFRALTGDRLVYSQGNSRSVIGIVALSQRQVVSASTDGTLMVWDYADSLRSVNCMSLHAEVRSVSFLPSRTCLAVDGLGSLRRCSLTSGRCEPIPVDLPAKATVLVSTSDGARIVVGTTDGSIGLWRIDGTQSISMRREHEASISCLAVSHNGTIAVSGSLDQTVVVWDLSSFTPLLRIRANAPITCAAALPDGSRVLYGKANGGIVMCAVSSGPEQRLDLHSGTVRALTVSSDGSLVASCGTDYLVGVWQRGLS